MEELTKFEWILISGGVLMGVILLIALSPMANKSTSFEQNCQEFCQEKGSKVDFCSEEKSMVICK